MRNTSCTHVPAHAATIPLLRVFSADPQWECCKYTVGLRCVLCSVTSILRTRTPTRQSFSSLRHMPLRGYRQRQSAIHVGLQRRVDCDIRWHGDPKRVPQPRCRAIEDLELKAAACSTEIGQQACAAIGRRCHTQLSTFWLHGSVHRAVTPAPSNSAWRRLLGSPSPTRSQGPGLSLQIRLPPVCARATRQPSGRPHAAASSYHRASWAVARQSGQL
jgi:hypothetical protein